MNTKIPLLIVLLTAVPLASALQAQGASWGAAGAPIEAAPGDTAKALTVFLRNDGPTTYSGVSARIGTATYQGATGYILPSSSGAVATLTGNLAPGDVWSAKFAVDIATDAQPYFVYSVPVTLDLYDRTNSTFVTQSVSVPVQITGRAALEVTVDDADLYAGGSTTLTVHVRNAGSGPAADVRLTTTPSQGVSLLEGDGLRTLGRLAPGASADIALRVRPSASGVATLTFALSYADSAGTAVSTSRSKTFTVDEPTTPTDGEHVAARIAERSVDAGTTANVTFMIWNNATATLRDLRASVATGSVLVVPDASDVQVLGDIASGQSLRMTMHVVTDNAARGIQKVPLTLAWTRGDGSEGTRTFNLAVPVVGTVSPSVTGATAGVNNQTRAATITATITNLGNTQALNAYIQVLGNANYNATQAQFIGDLSPKTGVPFTISTTLRNASALNATPAGAPPGGVPPFNGTFPGGAPGAGGQGFPRPENGAFPGGGNFTRGQGGLGGRGAAGAGLQLLITWTDDYGNPASQVLSVQATPRATTTSARATTASASGTSGILGIPSLMLAEIVGTLVVAAGLTTYVVKRRRS